MAAVAVWSPPRRWLADNSGGVVWCGRAVCVCMCVCVGGGGGGGFLKEDRKEG